MNMAYMNRLNNIDGLILHVNVSSGKSVSSRSDGGGRYDWRFSECSERPLFNSDTLPVPQIHLNVSNIGILGFFFDLFEFCQFSRLTPNQEFGVG